MLKDNMRIAREKTGQSKAAVVRELKIPYTTYDSYETGHRTPSPDLLPRIADALDTTVHFLLTGKQPVETQTMYPETYVSNFLVACGFRFQKDNATWIITDPDGNTDELTDTQYGFYLANILHDIKKPPISTGIIEAHKFAVQFVHEVIKEE